MLARTTPTTSPPPAETCERGIRRGASLVQQLRRNRILGTPGDPRHGGPFKCGARRRGGGGERRPPGGRRLGTIAAYGPCVVPAVESRRDHTVILTCGDD